MTKLAKIYLLISILGLLMGISMILMGTVFGDSLLLFILPVVLLFNGTISIPLVSALGLKKKTLSLSILSLISASTYLGVQVWLLFPWISGIGSRDGEGWYMVINWLLNIAILIGLLLLALLLLIVIEIYVRLKGELERRGNIYYQWFFKIIIPIFSVVITLFSIFIWLLYG